ncbi:MAG: hypothetical protein LBF16_08815, partial [Pseudomonadales bacterium]|nr:hypothetical protein [Pseudomonadales bacterium]
MNAAVLSDLIGSIYDCAIDPSRWQGTLHDIRRSLNFYNASLVVADPDFKDLRLQINDNVPVVNGISPYSLEYSEGAAANWGGSEKLAQLNWDEPQVLSWCNPRVTHESRLFIEWAKPQGIFDILGLGLTRDNESFSTLGMGRHKDAGPITQHEVNAARLLLPHLKRAVTLSRLLDIKTLTAATFESVINTLATAVVLVDAQLRVVHANTTATAVLAAGDLLHIDAGRLTVRSPSADHALTTAVAQVQCAGSSAARSGFNVPVRGTEGQRHVLHVMPIHTSTLRAQVMPHVAAAVFVAPASTPRTACMEAVAASFGLSPMETDVLKHLIKGGTNRQIAAAMGLGVASINTY